ncbi:type II secretion system protein GspM [Glaciimonas immobilis]|uniref:General secretion pathway protein M n=1 Tax=Glaciimonas immobilis TaxID=728004 RepID=A0A840RV14_9BURK|nr:type II secretion system protein GspM [Glaciimonas immobilis]KAF3996612.1 type II secretion system protein M [Glaciimonas immobilis]MBB5201012.1 general secretion pathway protein M [Glaciimonas immobilis]
MSTSSSKHPTIGKLQASLGSFWAQRNRSERRLLTSLIVFIVVALVYLTFVDPARQGRTRLQKELPTLHQQSAELQALIAKAAALPARQASANILPLSKDTLEASIKSKGLNPQSVIVNGETAKVQFSGVAFAALFDWLNDAQKNAHWQVSEANVNASSGRDVQSDSVNATITLLQQHHEQ